MTNNDTTEDIRRAAVAQINSSVESNDRDAERIRLESIHGKVWDTTEMTAEFEVIGFLAPFVVVKRRADGVKGTLQFQSIPRFYFSFREE